jgi:hypothetical protein
LSTASCTHPVNRAKYIWNANDLAAKRPTGLADIDGAIARLKEMFPLERVNWSAAQWRAFETHRKNKPVQDADPAIAIRPGRCQSTSKRDGIPVSL